MNSLYPIFAALISFSLTQAAFASIPVRSVDPKAFADSVEGLVTTIPLKEKELPASFEAGGNSRRVAIYDDIGAWRLGVQHYKKLLRKMKISYRVLSARDVLEGKLNLQDFDTLFMPGGKSWEYLASLGESGQQAVREFVDQGGSYFGTCAGGFFATSMREDRKRGHVPYGIGLLEGTAYDGTSFGTAPFKSGMITVNYHLADFKPSYRVLLLGGPAFLYTEEEAHRKNIQVLATYPTYNQPAMITLQYGKGRVAIAGPHGEIDEKKIGITLWRDPDSEWPMLRKVIHWLRGAEHPSLL